MHLSIFSSVITGANQAEVARKTRAFGLRSVQLVPDEVNVGWGFDGTGARRGDRFEGLVGPEADRVYLNRSTPRPMEVLSHSPYSCRGDRFSGPRGGSSSRRPRTGWRPRTGRRCRPWPP